MVTTTKQNTPWRGQEAANNLGLRGLGLVEKARLKGLKAVRQLRSGGAYRLQVKVSSPFTSRAGFQSS